VCSSLHGVTEPDVVVADQPSASRYTITVDGTPAGRLDYQLEAGLVSMHHAEIDPAMEGRGLGARLVSFALDDARGRGLEVLPRCPFVQRYVQRNPGYADLVPAGHRAHFGL